MSSTILFTWGEPMKQKQLARLAASLVGVTGGAARGHDHVIGLQEDCSRYPLWCQGYCHELNICRSGNTPIGGEDCGNERSNLALCEGRPPPPVPTVPVVIVPTPACPAGQHYNYSGGACQADHECGDDEIGGGSEECVECGEGTEPNEGRTECVSSSSSYKVARCERNLDLPVELGEYLPTHPNVVVESGDAREQRGFFPRSPNLAIVNGLIYVASLDNPFIAPIVIYVSSVVREDPDEGECTFTDVSKQRHDTVKDRMLNTVNTKDPWHRYHVVVRNSIAWGNEVLK